MAISHRVLFSLSVSLHVREFEGPRYSRTRHNAIGIQLIVMSGSVRFVCQCLSYTARTGRKGSLGVGNRWDGSGPEGPEDRTTGDRI